MRMKINLIAMVSVFILSVGGVQAAPIMWVDDASGNLGTVDVATGNVTLIGNTGIVLTDIAFDPSGNLFGISFTNLYKINSTTAATTLVGPHGVPGGNALVFGSDGTLFSAGFSSTSLFRINPATGATTNLGNVGFASGGDLAFNGGNFFLSSSTNQLIQIDLSNPSSSHAVGPFGISSVFGLASGEDGVLYGVAGTQIFPVNPATGAGSSPVNFAGHGLGSANGESFFLEATPGGGTVGAVPEPATLVLGTGLAGIIAARQLKKA
jgi:hypothetical protein